MNIDCTTNFVLHRKSTQQAKKWGYPILFHPWVRGKQACVKTSENN